MIKILAMFILACLATPVVAEKPQSLEELLEKVKKERGQEKEDIVKRELTFKNARDQQKKILAESLVELEKEKQQSATLKKQYDLYEVDLIKQNESLKQKMGVLRELDGVVRQIANDMNAIIDTSYISAAELKRDSILDVLAARKELPSLQDLEELWLLAMDEMVKSGEIDTFQGQIVTTSGNEIEQQITRIGTFNAVSNGHFLRKLPGTEKLIEPGRQPGKNFQKMALALENGDAGIYPFPIDPTRGAMLALLTQVPDLKHRITQGGWIGYVIIVIGLIGTLIAIERFAKLSITAKNIRQQLQNKQPGNNPLGRIMQVYKQNPEADTETLGLKLDEAVLKELPNIQRGLSTLALLAAISPLLGLLGTVTGIIETFQSITLYGSGDPRIMSGGISQALITTVLGLLIAIPLLLMHGFLSTRSNQLVQILDEKSIALVAALAERHRLNSNA